MTPAQRVVDQSKHFVYDIIQNCYVDSSVGPLRGLSGPAGSTEPMDFSRAKNRDMSSCHRFFDDAFNRCRRLEDLVEIKSSESVLDLDPGASCQPSLLSLDTSSCGVCK